MGILRHTPFLDRVVLRLIIANGLVWFCLVAATSRTTPIYRSRYLSIYKQPVYRCIWPSPCLLTYHCTFLPTYVPVAGCLVHRRIDPFVYLYLGAVRIKLAGVCMCAYMHTYRHTYIHTYIHTCTIHMLYIYEQRYALI